MAEISSEKIIEKRKNQIAALEQLSSNIQQTQNSLNTLTEQYSLNRGALLQLNDILEDMGIDIDNLKDQEPETPMVIEDSTETDNIEVVSEEESSEDL